MKHLSMLLMAAAFVLPVFTTACADSTSSPSPGSSSGNAPPAKEEDKQWTMQNKNYASTRYS